MADINLKKGIRPLELPFYMNWPAIINGNMKIVIQDEINQGDDLELQGSIYRVTEVHEARKARGVYTEEQRPNFYDLTVKNIAAVRYVEINNVAQREVIMHPVAIPLPVQGENEPTPVSNDEPF